MEVPRRGEEVKGDLRVENRFPWNFPLENEDNNNKKDPYH